MTEAPPKMSMDVTMMLVAKQKQKNTMCAVRPHRASTWQQAPSLSVKSYHTCQVQGRGDARHISNSQARAALMISSTV